MSDRPEVLVVTAEARLAERVATWLEDDRSVETAHDGEEAIEKAADSVEVVLLDRRLPALSGEDVRERIREAGYECRVVVVTAAEPDFDAVEMGVDDSLARPVGREELLTTIETVERRGAYETDVREYYSLVSEKALLESDGSERDLESRDEYRELSERVDELAERVDEAVSGLRSHEDFVGAFRDLRTEH